MAFIQKDWQDAPSTSTPIDAAALEDMETRLAAYADAVVAGLPASQGLSMVAGGGLGATHSETVPANVERWLTGTLTANLTLTVTLAAGASLRLLAAQDATGGRTLTVGSTVLPIPGAPNARFEVDFYSADGTTIYTSVATAGASPESVLTVGTVGATYTISQAASVYDLTLTANLTLTLPAPTRGVSFTLVLRQDATGGRTVTWPTVKWPGGAAPQLTATASAVDLVSLLSVNGTDWLGFPSGYDLR